MSYPDPYANPNRMRRNRGMALLCASAMLVLALIYVKTSHEKKVESYSALNAARSAEAMLPSAPQKKPVVSVDPKRKAYLADLKSTALKLSVDWNTRIASVENALGPELALNAVRIDGQKSEMELKGETSSNSKLTALIVAMQSTGLDARVGRVARFQSGNASGLEYAILVSWPQ